MLVPGIIAGIVVGAILAYYSKDHDVSFDKNITDKLNELPKIFESSHKTIKVATDFDPRFFDDERVKKSIGKALERGSKIMFLTEGKPPVWYTEQKKIEIKRVEKLPFHLMVIDDRHVRLERPHEPGRFGESKEDVALIFKDFPRLSKRYSQRFDELWRTVS